MEVYRKLPIYLAFVHQTTIGTGMIWISEILGSGWSLWDKLPLSTGKSRSWLTSNGKRSVLSCLEVSAKQPGYGIA